MIVVYEHIKNYDKSELRYTTSCPYCSTILSYYSYSPDECPGCREQLVEISELEDNIDIRKKWYNQKC